MQPMVTFLNQAITDKNIMLKNHREDEYDVEW